MADIMFIISIFAGLWACFLLWRSAGMTGHDRTATLIHGYGTLIIAFLSLLRS